MTSRIPHTSFDALDAHAQSVFWSQVLDFIEDPDDPNEPGHQECLIMSRDRSQLLLFITVPGSKMVKNRVHLDLRPADRTREQETERILALGASQLADHRRSDGSGWITLGDPEGNEFCILSREAVGSGATTWLTAVHAISLRNPYDTSHQISRPAHDPRQKRSGGAYHRRVGLWPEPSWSSCRARCAVGVPAGTGDDPYRHRAEHALHAGTHMANSDRVYLVVPQEPCHTGVMGTFGPLVVQRSPGNGELLPVADLLVGHVGDRDPVGSSPARVDLAIICDWHAYPHVEKPPRRSPEILGASGFPRSRSNQTRQPAQSMVNW